MLQLSQKNVELHYHQQEVRETKQKDEEEKTMGKKNSMRIISVKIRMRQSSCITKNRRKRGL